MKNYFYALSFKIYPKIYNSKSKDIKDICIRITFNTHISIKLENVKS